MSETEAERGEGYLSSIEFGSAGEERDMGGGASGGEYI
jgi:hypothetical protein